MSNTVTCPIWGTPAILVRQIGDAVIYDSPRAGGVFQITGTADHVVRNWLEDQKMDHLIDRMKLTQHIVESFHNNTMLEVTSYNLSHLLRTSRWNLQKRAHYLLHKLAYETEKVGDWVSCSSNPHDPEAQGWTAWSGSEELGEIRFLLNFLTEQCFIDELSGPTSSDLGTYSITVHGFLSLEDDGPNLQSDEAFIAMWFDDSTKDAFEQGIDIAVRSAGYKPIRIDREEHINKICDEIVSNIKRSRFVVADFTCGTHQTIKIDEHGKNIIKSEPRGGVYFEAGLAQGQGIPVIWACRKDMLEHVHFDTRQYNHIVWSNPDELAEKLQTRIEAIIGDGPLK